VLLHDGRYVGVRHPIREAVPSGACPSVIRRGVVDADLAGGRSDHGARRRHGTALPSENRIQTALPVGVDDRDVGNLVAHDIMPAVLDLRTPRSFACSLMDAFSCDGGRQAYL
jgi:hypothetical protein